MEMEVLVSPLSVDGGVNEHRLQRRATHGTTHEPDAQRATTASKTIVVPDRAPDRALCRRAPTDFAVTERTGRADMTER